jgi:hypothetical protein
MCMIYRRENSLNPTGLYPQFVHPICLSLHRICYSSSVSNFESRKWLVTIQDIFAVLISNADQPGIYLHPHISLLTLVLLTWSIGWAPNKARKWQIGFNSVFKGLIALSYKSSSRITGNVHGLHSRWIAVYLPVIYGKSVSLNIILILHWSRGQYFPPKQWYPFTNLNDVATK